MGDNGKALKEFHGKACEIGVGDLFRIHAPALRSFCYRLLSDSALADDAVQQTFEIVLGSYGDLRDPARSRAWIFQIARNECFRLLKRPRHLQLEEGQTAGRVSTPFHAAVDSDVRSIVREAIDGLPHIYREAVVLRDMEGFSYAEIAVITGVAISAVKFRIYRGRELLMEMLQPVLKEWRMP
jgi:RNA polymerase sigma-70 factor (ECF subfamily)